MLKFDMHPVGKEFIGFKNVTVNAFWITVIIYLRIHLIIIVFMIATVTLKETDVSSRKYKYL